MSEVQPNLPTIQMARSASPGHVHTIELPDSHPSISSLQHATADLYRLPHSALTSLTFHYLDEVRCHTTQPRWCHNGAAGSCPIDSLTALP